MSITVDEIRKIALLAGLRLGPDEARELGPQMDGIVRFVDEMGEPQHSGDKEEVESTAPVREAADEPRPGLPRERVLANAPDRWDGHVRMPPVRAHRIGPPDGAEGEEDR